MIVGLALILGTGCENVPFRRQVKLDVGGDTITLAKGVKLVDITIASTQQEFDPPSAKARIGDVARFTTADSRTHLLEFDSSIPAAAQQRFAAQSQMRSPPLLQKGAAWIVTLDSIPTGDYRYTCRIHGASGLITIR